MKLYTFKEINFNEYEEYNKWNDRKAEYKRKVIIDDSRNSENFFIYKGNFRYDLEAVEYGALISFLISEEIDMDFCKVELAKRVGALYNYYDRGSISIYKQKINDKILNGYLLMNKYLSRFNKKYLIDKLYDINPSLDLFFDAIHYAIVDVGNMNEEYYQKSKQMAIDMIIFDCSFLNYDRSSENWSLICEEDTKNVRFYSIYDTETILGMDERMKDINMHLNESSVNDYCESWRYKMCVPGTERRDAGSIIAYLKQKYPVETKKSIEKVLKLKRTKLEEILNNCEGLPPERIEFALQVFDEQNMLLNKAYSELNRKYFDFDLSD